MISWVVVDNIAEAVNNFVRSFMITLDRVVYWFVEQVLQLIVDLSNVNIFSDTSINAFARRIYIILGLIMVFKLMISFIQILIDPEAMSDKEKGVGNILKRVVISMALIVLVPSIFKMARDVQGYILPVIPKVILGIESNNNVTDPITENNIGNVMAWYSFLPFFDYANDACAATGTIQKAVGGEMDIYEIYSVGTAAEHINDKHECNGGNYMYDHRILISTIVGAFLLYSLVTVAINVAIRALKFGICEFVAPIPIASYIDPKTSKSTFDKWLNISIKVYLDLFIQLISIYFVVFVFMVVFTTENLGAMLANVGNDTWRATLVMLFIIIGLIKFVKDFPKFLSDLLGLKTDGALASIFKGEGYKDIKSAYNTLASTAATPLAAYRSMRKNWNYSREAGENKFTSFRRAVGGYVGATRRGLKTAYTGKSGYRDAYNGIYDETTGISKAKVNKRIAADMHKNEREELMNEYTQRRANGLQEADNTRKNRIAAIKAKYQSIYDSLSPDEVKERLFGERQQAFQTTLDEKQSEYLKAETTKNNLASKKTSLESRLSAIQKNLNSSKRGGDKLALTKEYEGVYSEYMNVMKDYKQASQDFDLARTERDRASFDLSTYLQNKDVEKENLFSRYQQDAQERIRMRDKEIGEANAEYKAKSKSIEDAYQQSMDTLPSEMNIVKEAMDAFIYGKDKSTSEDVKKAVSTFTSSKSAALGEARGKQSEIAALGLLKVKIKGKEIDFREILAANNRYTTSTVGDKETADTIVIKTDDDETITVQRGEFEGVFERAKKDADVEIVDLANRGVIDNPKIRKVIKDFKGFLASSNITDRNIIEYLEKMIEDGKVGKAIKLAGDIAENIERTGNQRSAFEVAKKQVEQNSKN